MRTDGWTDGKTWKQYIHIKNWNKQVREPLIPVLIASSWGYPSLNGYHILQTRNLESAKLKTIWTKNCKAWFGMGSECSFKIDVNRWTSLARLEKRLQWFCVFVAFRIILSACTCTSMPAFLWAKNYTHNLFNDTRRKVGLLWKVHYMYQAKRMSPHEWCIFFKKFWKRDRLEARKSPPYEYRMYSNKRPLSNKCPLPFFFLKWLQNIAIFVYLPICIVSKRSFLDF